jgi:hypothetical protein
MSNNPRSISGSMNPLPTLQVIGASLGRIANLAATAYLAATVLTTISADRRTSETPDRANVSPIPQVVPPVEDFPCAADPVTNRARTSLEENFSSVGEEPW